MSLIGVVRDVRLQFLVLNFYQMKWNSELTGTGESIAAILSFTCEIIVIISESRRRAVAVKRRFKRDRSVWGVQRKIGLNNQNGYVECVLT